MVFFLPIGFNLNSRQKRKLIQISVTRHQCNLSVSIRKDFHLMQQKNHLYFQFGLIQRILELGESRLNVSRHNQDEKFISNS